VSAEALRAEAAKLEARAHVCAADAALAAQASSALTAVTQGIDSILDAQGALVIARRHLAGLDPAVADVLEQRMKAAILDVRDAVVRRVGVIAALSDRKGAEALARGEEARMAADSLRAAAARLGVPACAEAPSAATSAQDEGGLRLCPDYEDR
jgi:hypothetical protein